MYRGSPAWSEVCSGLAHGLLALALPGWAPCPLNTLLFSRTSLWGPGRAARGPQGAVTVRPQHSCGHLTLGPPVCSRCTGTCGPSRLSLQPDCLSERVCGLLSPSTQPPGSYYCCPNSAWSHWVLAESILFKTQQSRVLEVGRMLTVSPQAFRWGPSCFPGHPSSPTPRLSTAMGVQTPAHTQRGGPPRHTPARCPVAQGHLFSRATPAPGPAGRGCLCSEPRRARTSPQQSLSLLGSGSLMASDCVLIPFGLALEVYLSNDCVGDSRAPRQPTGIPAFREPQNWPRVAPALRAHLHVCLLSGLQV